MVLQAQVDDSWSGVGVGGVSRFWMPTPLLPPSPSIPVPHRNRAEKNGGNLLSNSIILGGKLRPRGVCPMVTQLVDPLS